MTSFVDAKRIVIKVGTSTLVYGKTGRMNLRCLEKLCKVISDLHNRGREVILVSSGAIGIGMGKLHMEERPDENSAKQALAAIGQCELMFIYDKLFGEYNQIVAQILLTADDIEDRERRENIESTFDRLLHMGIIPIVNENDTVGIAELEGKHIGDNDTLSAIVAELVDADGLVILTDIDGLYDGDPRENPDAKLIPYVKEITDEIEALAGSAGTYLGTGGMKTKLHAAKRANDKNILCCIMNGSNPGEIYHLLDGKQIGTVFGTGSSREVRKTERKESM